MAFEPITAPVPVSIGEINTNLFDPDPSSGLGIPKSAHATVQIVMSDGTSVYRTYNPANHLPPETIQQLIAFVDSLRTKANNEILP